MLEKGNENMYYKNEKQWRLYYVIRAIALLCIV